MTPAYLTDIEIATVLNRSKNWLCKERSTLERAGFPRKDPLIGLTCAADVHAWIARRRQVPDHVEVHGPGHHHITTTSGPHGDDLAKL